MLVRRVSLRQVASLLGVLGAAACSTGSDSTGALATGEQNVSTIVQAAIGTTLALEDGTRVVIPAGALESDAEVSLSRETCEGIYAATRFQSCVYRVSAPDAALVGRYTVSIPSRGEAGARTDCAVALTDDGWRCLVDTETSGESSEASASAFTDFAIRASSNDLADDRCTDAPFEPCGGDLLGNWTLTGVCGSMQEVLGVTFSFDNPPYEACDPFDHYMDYPFSIEGSLEFQDDGVLRTLETFQISGHTLVTEECLAEVGEACGDDCVLENGVCDCLSLSSAGQGGSSAEWTPGDSGTFFYYEQAFEYCVNGDRLTVEFPGYDGATPSGCTKGQPPSSCRSAFPIASATTNVKRGFAGTSTTTIPSAEEVSAPSSARPISIARPQRMRRVDRTRPPQGVATTGSATSWGRGWVLSSAPRKGRP